MSDISGPQNTRETTNTVRGTEKPKAVSKDPDGTRTAPEQQSQNQSQPQSKEAYQGRDPAVSIAASTALLKEGQHISGAIAKLDAEGRPILETNTAIVALRPDAGLQPSDIVTLKVVETGKELAADLVKRNGSAEVSPPRVALTIISIKGTPLLETETIPLKAEQTGAGYGPRVRPSTDLGTEDAKLALLLKSASASARPDQTAQSNPPIKSTSPQPNTLSAATSVLAQTDTQRPAQNSAGGAASGATLAATANATPAALKGLGVAIPAATADGRTVQLQPLDLAISNVPPRDIAVVERITPLAAIEAKALTIPAVLLSPTLSTQGSTEHNTDRSLVRLETTKGAFVASAHTAAHLSGESVRITADTTSTSREEPVTAAIGRQYRALWVENSPRTLPQKVTVELSSAQGETQVPERALASATITSVQTVSAFIGATGPNADLRLQTTHGDVSLTVPSAARPLVGDTVHILAENTRIETPLPAPAPTEVSVNASTSVAAQAATQTAASGMLSNWPVYEEAVATLTAANPGAAAALTEKSAQGGAKLTNSLLFFLKAAGRATSSDAWIGEKATSALETTSRNLLDNLKNDIQQMARMATEPVGEWRPVILPFEARLGDFPLVAFLLQNQQHRENGEDPEQSPEGTDEDTQRFVVQVAFSVLGDIQLDGRIKQGQFDLTVRSKQSFSSELTQDTQTLFEQALAANSYDGRLRFEETDTFPLDAAAIAASQLMPPAHTAS